MTNYPRQFAFGLILACTVGAALAQSPPAPLQYADDFAALGRTSAATGTPIMPVFTPPGCPFCTRAKRDHLEPLHANPAYAANVVLRETEAPNDRIALRGFDGAMTTHAGFARQYSVRTVPTVILVDSHGTVLTDAIVGLNLAEFCNLYLEQAIDAARLRLRAPAR